MALHGRLGVFHHKIRKQKNRLAEVQLKLTRLYSFQITLQKELAQTQIKLKKIQTHLETLSTLLEPIKASIRGHLAALPCFTAEEMRILKEETHVSKYSSDFKNKINLFKQTLAELYFEINQYNQLELSKTTEKPSDSKSTTQLENLIRHAYTFDLQKLKDTLDALEHFMFGCSASVGVIFRDNETTAIAQLFFALSAQSDTTPESVALAKQIEAEELILKQAQSHDTLSKVHDDIAYFTEEERKLLNNLTAVLALPIPENTDTLADSASTAATHSSFSYWEKFSDGCSSRMTSSSKEKPAENISILPTPA